MEGNNSTIKQDKVLIIKPNGKVKYGRATSLHEESELVSISFKLKGKVVEHNYSVKDKKWCYDFFDDPKIYAKVVNWILIFK